MTLRAVSKREIELGRYLTGRELANVQQRGTSNDLTAPELRALRRIWPGFDQLEFKLERRSVKQTTSRSGDH